MILEDIMPESKFNKKVAKLIMDIAHGNANESMRDELKSLLSNGGDNAWDAVADILRRMDGDSQGVEISFRVINPTEIRNLTDDATEHLLAMRNDNFISEEVFEDVLLDVSISLTVVDLNVLKDIIGRKSLANQRIVN